MKKAKENWTEEQCREIEENLRKNYSKRAYQLEKDLTTVTQGKLLLSKIVQENASQKERYWTDGESSSELYNHKASGDPSELNCPQTDTEDDHPILRKEMEAAVQSPMIGKSAGVDNIPVELVQARGEDVISALTTICNKI